MKRLPKPTINFRAAPSKNQTAAFPPLPGHNPIGPGSTEKHLVSLLNHATNGFTVPDLIEAKNMGHDAWLDWRAERVAPGTREAFLALCEEVAAGDDHAGWAAWWWLRNRLFFDLGLDRLAQVVRPLGYEGLVRDPSSWLAKLCAFAGLADADVMAASVHARSVGKSAAPPVPGAVADACDRLFASLADAAALAWRA